MRCEINFRVALGTLLMVAGLSVSWVLAADPPPEGEEVTRQICQGSWNA